MSQEKVNAYKEAKKTRKQDAQKAKNAQNARRVGFYVVAILLAGLLVFGIGLTIKNQVDAEAKQKEDLLAALLDDNFILGDYGQIQPEEVKETKAPAIEGEATK